MLDKRFISRCHDCHDVRANVMQHALRVQPGENAFHALARLSDNDGIYAGDAPFT